MLPNEPGSDDKNRMDVSLNDTSILPSVSQPNELTNTTEAQETANTKDDSIEKMFEHLIQRGFRVAVERFLLYGAESTVTGRIDEGGERQLVFTKGTQTITIPAAGITSQKILKKSWKAYRNRKSEGSKTRVPKPQKKGKSGRALANDLRFQEDMIKGRNTVRAAVQPNGYCEPSLLAAPGQACKEL